MSAPAIVAAAAHVLERFHHEYQVLPLYDALVAYRDEGQPVGGFLTALLTHDLMDACARADNTNLWLLPIYTAFLYNDMPSPAHGSPAKVAAWLAMHREQREQRAVAAAGGEL